MKKGDRSLPPDTPSVMASYKEPLKPVESGFGYYGTIAYDKEKKHTQCHICGWFFKELGHHISKAHDKNPKQYKMEYGLPSSLPLAAPEKKNNHLERWARMSELEKKRYIQKMNEARGSARKPHRKESLYIKNLKGRCPDQLLDKIESLAKKLTHTPSMKEFIKEYGHGDHGAVLMTYGSWSQALKILKLSPKSANHYDKALLVQILNDFKERFGREPFYSDLRKGLMPSGNTYKRHFGSWSKAKEYIK